MSSEANDGLGAILRAAFGPSNEDMVKWADLVGASTQLEAQLATARADERKAVVEWLRGQGERWEQLSRQSAERGAEYAGITHSQALVAAGYSDHAYAIEQGRHAAE